MLCPMRPPNVLVLYASVSKRTVLLAIQAPVKQGVVPDTVSAVTKSY